MNYLVTLDVAASISIEVKADNEDAAVDLALTKVHVPSLCVHCARRIDIGDITGQEPYVEALEE